MINFSKEIRYRKSLGIYDLMLEIPENDFYVNYKSPGIESAKEILDDYLINRKDLGKVVKVEIFHDKKKHIVRLKSQIDYNNECS